MIVEPPGTVKTLGICMIACYSNTPPQPAGPLGKDMQLAVSELKPKAYQETRCHPINIHVV